MNAASRIRVRATREAAGPGEWARAIAALDRAPGLYCASLHGVAGVHPRFAWGLDEVALVLHVHANRVVPEPLAPVGQRLLQVAPVLAVGSSDGASDGASGERPWRHPVVRWLRAFLAAFDAPEPFGLYGALRFEAHRLAGPWQPDDGSLLGTLFVPLRVLWSPDGEHVECHRFEFEDSFEREDTVGAASPAAMRTPSAAQQSPREPVDDHPPGGHAQRIALGLQALGDPALVSLTLSQSFRRPWQGVASQAFERLRAANPAPVTFFMNLTGGEHLFGASPDLQLDVRGRDVRTFPVCGTVRLGTGPIARAEALKTLLNESVDEASLAICSDALAEDLAPLCEPGSLRLVARREPMMLSTVVHGVDALAGRLRDGVDGFDAIVATAAPAMVTGTPRSLALACIERLEASPRAWYGGMVVRIGANGDAQAGTILRAAWLRDGLAEVRCGGDLVADSDPQREEDETRLKAISVWRALGLLPAAPQSPAAGATGDAVDTGDTGDAGETGETGEMSDSASGSGGNARPGRIADPNGASWNGPQWVLHLAGEPFENRLRDGLALALPAGPGTAETVHVIAGADRARVEALEHSLSGKPVLLLGSAAVWRLAADDDRFAATPRPDNARLVRVQAVAGSEPMRTGGPHEAGHSQGWPSGFFAGCYGPRLIARRASTSGSPSGQAADSASGSAAGSTAGSTAGSPAGRWRAVQVGADGEWLTAVDAQDRRAAIVYRPDSVLSEAAALESLRCAVAWLLAPR